MRMGNTSGYEKQRQTHLNIFHELIVAVDVDRLELPHFIKLKLDLNWLPITRFILPANPAKTWNKR